MIEALLRTPAARAAENGLFAPGQTLHAPHLFDVEVAQEIRRYATKGQIDGERGRAALTSDPVGMSRPRADPGGSSDDLYLRFEPSPRIGRPPKHDLSTWTVTDGWPQRVPVTGRDVDVFQAWFGDIPYELFRAP